MAHKFHKTVHEFQEHYYFLQKNNIYNCMNIIIDGIIYYIFIFHRKLLEYDIKYEFN